MSSLPASQRAALTDCATSAVVLLHLLAVTSPAAVALAAAGRGFLEAEEKRLREQWYRRLGLGKTWAAAAAALLLGSKQET